MLREERFSPETSVTNVSVDDTNLKYFTINTLI
jgi:hypothetical protein